MLVKLVAQIFTSSIRSKKFDFLATLIFYFLLKLFKLLKSFRLMFHKINITITTQVISKGYKVEESTACRCTHRTTYIRMYYFHQVTCPFNISIERCFGHLSRKTSFANIKRFKIE